MNVNSQMHATTILLVSFFFFTYVELGHTHSENNTGTVCSRIGFQGIYSLLIKIQPDTTVCRYLFTVKSLYMFRVSQHPSSGVLKTVTATSGTAASLQRGLETTLEGSSCTSIMTCTRPAGHVGGK